MSSKSAQDEKKLSSCVIQIDRYDFYGGSWHYSWPDYQNYDNVYFDSSVPSWSRYWNNATTLRQSSSKKSKANWPYVPVVVTVPEGPRLAYKIRARNGNLVWARKPIQIIIYKRVPPKRQGKMRVPLTTPPNYLEFSKTTYNYGSTGVVSFDNGSQKDVIMGPLWSSFRILLNNSIVPVGQWTNPGFINEVSAAEARCDEIALKRFYAKAKNSNENLAQDLAERRQTVRMISDMAVTLAKALLQMRRGNFSAAVKSLLPGSPKGAANGWLMYQYGVRPLISGLDGIAKTLAEQEPFAFDITASATEEVPEATVATYGNIGYFSTDATVRASAEVTVKYKCRVTVDSAAMRNYTRLGFGNLPDLLWELIPYSFVADWFIPIGGYLSSLDAFDGLRVEWTTRTVFIKQKTKMVRQFGGTISGWNTSSASSFFNTEKIYCRRDVLPLRPSLNLPSLKDPTSALHIANATALLVQLSKR